MSLPVGIVFDDLTDFVEASIFFFDFNIASEAMASISIGPAHGNRFFVHS